MTTVSILHVGPPSAPVLTVVPTDFETFNFVISPLSEPSDCVLSYSITPTTSDGSVLADITVEPPDSGDSIRVTMSGFDVCNTAYTFTVTTPPKVDPLHSWGMVGQVPTDIVL